MDLVRIFETYCTANDIEFMYGSKSHLNLLESDIDPNKIYLLLFPVRRKPIANKLGTKLITDSYSGNFFLLKGSNRDLHYFNEREQPESTSKFTINIEQLLTTFKEIGNSLMCDEVNLILWENIDAIDVLDANKDGLWCTYQLSKDE